MRTAFTAGPLLRVHDSIDRSEGGLRAAGPLTGWCARWTLWLGPSRGQMHSAAGSAERYDVRHQGLCRRDARDCGSFAGYKGR